MSLKSDHARLSYSETGDDLFGLFEQELFNTAKVPTTVATQDGAAELYLVDSTYALVGQGIGSIVMDLAPGPYQIRQRVGDTESVHEFQVCAAEPATLTLPLLDFPTPIPLPGSALSSGSGLEYRVLDAQPGNFRLLLWTPVPDEPADDVLGLALEHLSLETFNGRSSVALAAQRTQHSAWTCLDLQPGSYVLAQKTAQGRRCFLPLRIAEGMVTSVYLVQLRDGNGQPVPLELQHAAITLLPATLYGEQLIGPLRRLEAARKALALGRNVRGWSAWDTTGNLNNPLLALIDGQLEDLAELGSVLGDSEQMASGQAQAEVLGAPPVLRRSWSRLLQTPAGNEALQGLFTFDYEVEGSYCWFIWSQVVEAADKSPTVQGAAPNPLGLVQMLAHRFTWLHKFIAPPNLTEQNLNAPTYEELVGLFVWFVENPGTRSLLIKTYKSAWDALDGEMAPAVQRICRAFETMDDGALVKAMGGRAVLVRSALDSLGFPKARREQYARSLLRLLVKQLDENDRQRLGSFVNVAKWLFETADTPRIPQDGLEHRD